MSQSQIEQTSGFEISQDAPASSAGSPHRTIALLAELAEHKKPIFFITLICMVIGLILCFVLPERFEGVAVIMTPTARPSMAALIETEGLGALSSIAGAGLGLKDPNSTFIGILQSRTIADNLIYRFHLLDLYRAKDMTAARQKLLKRTDIQEDKSGLVSIRITDNDPRRAADMANAYVEQLRTLTKQMSAEEDARQRSYFEDQLKLQREALITAEVELQKIQQSKGIVQPTGQAAALLGTMVTLRAEIAAQQAEVQALRAYATDHNPDVQIAEKSLEAMKQQASKMSQHGSSADFGDVGLKDVPTAGLDYIRAERDVQYQTALYSLLLKQYEAARLDESNDAYSIQVVDHAVMPDRRSFPKRTILMAIAMLAGLGFSYGWIWFEKRWQEWMKSEEFVISLASFKGALHFR